MDWKRLVQFALLGSSDLEQYAIFLVRLSLGRVLRHLRGQEVVCCRQQANYVRNAR